MITSSIILKYLRTQPNMMIYLGSLLQKGSLFVNLETYAFWKKESTERKFASILRRRYEPDAKLIERVAKGYFMAEIFGEPNDYSEQLYYINTWHNSQPWKFEHLADSDEVKINGLRAISWICVLQFRQIQSNHLNLKLAERTPFISFLLFPIVVKTPVVSVRYYLDLHAEFAFNSIRKAKHPFADELISYLYELQFIQYKVALSLLDVLKLAMEIKSGKKAETQFTLWEARAIMACDLVFSYLKASIEKTIVLIGFIYGIKGLDAKKNHKDKLNSLFKNLPLRATNQPYWKFVEEQIKSESLDELNNYRSGLLHKRGIADLQPHNYVGKGHEDIPLLKIFFVLHEQHSKNTAILIATLALLTDELVHLDQPSDQQAFSDMLENADTNWFTSFAEQWQSTG